LGELDGPPAYIHVARTHSLANFRQGYAESVKPVRINNNAVLLDEATDTCDLRDAFRLGNPIADIPILNGAQLGKTLLGAANDILIHPANPGGVRSERRSNPDGKPPRGKAEIFEHARARPIKV